MREKIKKIPVYISCISYLYFILTYFVMNRVAFSFFFFILGTLLMVYYYLFKLIDGKKGIKMLINIIISVFLIIFSFVEFKIVSYPKETTTKSDYIVVLGARVVGKEPGLTLKGRLERACEYATKYNNKCKIVVSGGKGDGERISEAEAMKRYLVSKGIDENRIIKEDKSVNTQQNFLFSKDKIENDSNKSISNIKVTAVTTDFHAFRSSLYAKRAGYKEVSFFTRSSEKILIPVMYTREFFAVIKAYTIAAI